MCCVVGFALFWVNFLFNCFLMFCLQSFTRKEEKKWKEEGERKAVNFFWMRRVLFVRHMHRKRVPIEGFLLRETLIQDGHAEPWYNDASWMAILPSKLETVRSWGCRTGVCLCQVSRVRLTAFGLAPWRHHIVVPWSQVCLSLVQQLAAWLPQ